MKTGRHPRLGIAIVAVAALTPCCTWIGWNSPAESIVASLPTPTPELTPPAPPPEPPRAPEHHIVPTAKAVPGRQGFVFSPFNNQLIDVSDFKSGTLVSDPRFTLSERKFFRVP